MLGTAVAVGLFTVLFVVAALHAVLVQTQAQIDAYGAKELHVLEDVLRQRDRKTMRAVAARIARKIDWTHGEIDDDHDFLSAYYAALRKRLEARLLMGVRRRDKHDV